MLKELVEFRDKLDAVMHKCMHKREASSECVSV